jgi:hypothetical protein
MSTIVTELCVQFEVRAETKEIAEHQCTVSYGVRPKKQLSIRVYYELRPKEEASSM